MNFKIGYSINAISAHILLFYYFIVFASAVYILNRFGKSKFTIFVVVVFWAGFFYYLDYNGFGNINIYKIGVFYLGVSLFAKNIFSINTNRDIAVNIIFLLFTFSYFVAQIINNYSIVTYLSQYSFKYFFPFLIYHGLKGLKNKSQVFDRIAKFLVFIMIIQILLSIFKLISFQMVNEFIVGSMQLVGGGLAVVSPIIGFILFWLYRRGDLNTKDWVIVLSFIFIALASAKRTPVILLPIFIFLVTTYISKGIQIKSILKYGPLVLLLFYFGVKTNYTLNPEGSTWGSFDINYVFRYVLNYYFGTDEIMNIGDTGMGRGGSILLIFNPAKFGFNNYTEMLFGKNLVSVVSGDMGRFVGGKYGVNHVGLMSAAPTMLYQLGYVGFVLYLSLILTIIGTIKHKRFKKIIIFWFLLDFLLYYNSTFLDNSMSVLMIFIIFYSNVVFQNNGLSKNINTKKLRIQKSRSRYYSACNSSISN
jgi:hypothetical protein